MKPPQGTFQSPIFELIAERNGFSVVFSIEQGESEKVPSESEASMTERHHRVFLWVLVLCAMVIMMVVIGGVTRLTGSGLSMVEWKPLMGAIPPVSNSDWLDVFGKYQESPQYQLINYGMTLLDFQWIFFWEYFHRLIGRLMGIVFMIPWAFFWIRGYFNRKWAGRFLLGFLLGGLQGLMGWLMVASGLVDQPQVSHYRLAAHLLLAFFILAYFWRLGWSYYTEAQGGAKPVLAPLSDDQQNVFRSLRLSLNVILVVLLLQILYGALVAGLRAGFMYNTFPDMEGQFFPLGAWHFNPGWKNLFDNPLTVQWIHRMLGWTLFGGALGLWWKFRGTVPAAMKRPIAGLAIVVLAQFMLGVLTLLFKVTLPLAVIHQVGASVVLMFMLWLRWEVQYQIKTP
jgi:cytochrome c oxidase assembly protein subunit 15